MDHLNFYMRASTSLTYNLLVPALFTVEVKMQLYTQLIFIVRYSMSTHCIIPIGLLDMEYEAVKVYLKSILFLNFCIKQVVGVKGTHSFSVDKNQEGVIKKNYLIIISRPVQEKRKLCGFMFSILKKQGITIILFLKKKMYYIICTYP